MADNELENVNQVRNRVTLLDHNFFFWCSVSKLAYGNRQEAIIVVVLALRYQGPT